MTLKEMFVDVFISSASVKYIFDSYVKKFFYLTLALLTCVRRRRIMINSYF